MNLREGVTCIHLSNLNKAAHSGFEIQRRHHQKSKIGSLPLLAMIALLTSCAQMFIHNAIMLIDTSDNALYNQVHWLIRTPYLSIKASNDQWLHKEGLSPPKNFQKKEDIFNVTA